MHALNHASKVTDLLFISPSTIVSDRFDYWCGGMIQILELARDTYLQSLILLFLNVSYKFMVALPFVVLK